MYRRGRVGGAAVVVVAQRNAAAAVAQGWTSWHYECRERERERERELGGWKMMDG